MPQFYTLDEAARMLGTSPDELKRMADRNELRAFRDRGTLRFRAPEIEELARRRGRGSDPDLPLGETSPSRPATPAPQKGSPKPGEVFDFALDSGDSDQVEIGQELLSGSSSRVGKGGGKPPSSKKQKSPPPKPGSDSDVRLVSDGSELDFKIASDSDVKMVDSPAPAAPPAKPSTPPKRKTGSSKSRLDSGVQMVPLDSAADSDLNMPDAGPDSGVSLNKPPPKTGSDSDIRLESSPRPNKNLDSPGDGSSDSILTDEIDLDAELRQQAEAERSRSKKRRSRTQPQQPPQPPQPQLPTTSPFELSESDLDLPASESSPTTSSDELPAAPGTEDSSSDFELTPAGDSSPEEPSSDEFKLSSDDEVTLGELTGSESKSGINLKDPADSGISLEQGGSDDSLEFELTLDSDSGPRAPATPAPAAAGAAKETDSSSEFELSLEEEPQPAAAAAEDSDSEFELSLDSEGDLEPSSSPTDDSSPVDSDSEFELTLDDSGGLALEEEGTAEQGAEGDIFEEDFEVPSLEEESGSEAVALEDSDTDLESSDFDIALGDEDVAAEDESGSQVVALEEGEEEAEAGGAVLEDSDEVEELFDAEGEEETGRRAPAAAAVAAAPAEWGVLPAIVMLPCVIVMFLVCLMSYELVRRDGTNNPNMLTKAVAGLFGEETK
jgi:excisionase family DNA binding protein